MLDFKLLSEVEVENSWNVKKTYMMHTYTLEVILYVNILMILRTNPWLKYKYWYVTPVITMNSCIKASSVVSATTHQGHFFPTQTSRQSVQVIHLTGGAMVWRLPMVCTLDNCYGLSHYKELAQIYVATKYISKVL